VRRLLWDSRIQVFSLAMQEVFYSIQFYGD